jgi:hypothetical protein
MPQPLVTENAKHIVDKEDNKIRPNFYKQLLYVGTKISSSDLKKLKDKAKICLETQDKSVESSKYDRHEIMMIALTSLSKRAPWLLRSNATSVQKLWMLAGMDTEEWVTWLANPGPISPRGRVGSIIDMEMRTLGPAPIAVEWSLSKKKEMYPLLDSLTKSYGRWCDYPDVDGLRRDLKKLYEKGEYQEMYNFFTERFEYWVTFK